MTRSAAVQQLLGLSEPGDDVTAQDQVGVGITHHQDVGHERQSARLAREKSTLTHADDRPCSFQARPAMLRQVTTIAFVGAGSAEFTRQLLRDLLSYDDLAATSTW